MLARDNQPVASVVSVDHPTDAPIVASATNDLWWKGHVLHHSTSVVICLRCDSPLPRFRDRLVNSRRDFLAASGAAFGAMLPLSRRPLPLPALGDWSATIGGPAATAADRMAWWREARFGMFIHFGLYSILGGAWGGKTDYGEWIRNNAKIPIDEYEKLLGRFNPVEFDADRIAKMAADAGMKYLVITTKHHDGFNLWPSRHTDWSVRNTPYKKDIMKAVVEACRAHGVKPCWYHSIMDWHHPDYLPRRDWEKASRPETGAQFDRFVRYLHAEVEELLTQYGEMGVMWFDGEWESTWSQELGAKLLEHCHTLSPNTLVNSRVSKQPANGLDAKLSKPALGDFGTPEQKIPDRGLPGVDWESCITMNGNWGYNKADKNFKSLPTLVEMLTETASKGGNLLLNIGPTGTGAVPPESVNRLAGLKQWMSVHASAIHGTEASPFEGAPFRATRKRSRLNVFLPQWPAQRELVLPGVRTKPVSAQMLGDRRRTLLPLRLTDSGVVVTLPAAPSDPTCSVLAVEMSETIPAAY
jgi:alpha-L-fucosidase